MLLWIIISSGFLVILAEGCGYPGSPAHATISFSTERIVPGTVATYHCDRGFELLGPSRRVCNENSTWSPPGIPFCVLNVAVGKAPMQSSVSPGGFPQKAIDGSTSPKHNPDTCTMTLTEVERAPWWYVNLLEPYMVQLVRIDFGRPCCANNVPATVVIRVGNHRPDLAVNPICSRYVGPIEEGRPLFLPCSPPMAGAFVSIHLEGPLGNPLSICEAFVYTDQAVPLESCPSFRDQPLGSTATFNGKCYIFYNNQPTSFEGARRVCESRGGNLVDETSPVLQGFLSWELWQRHRAEPSGQYWMGAVRDKQNPNNWKWLSGNDVTLSFWNLPGGNENCSRFDGTRGWLWSDTNCLLNLNFICQHKPLSCGHPEQPPNSTLTVTSREFIPGTVVRYMCSPGDLLIGPERRVCQPNGYYNEYPPKCRHLECGSPADIPNGGFRLVNGTQFYMSMVQYFCHEGYTLVGRGDLICDVDEKWDGPPPRCESRTCPPPPLIQNGYFTSSTNVTITGTTVTYFCSSPAATLIGSQSMTCGPNGLWSADPPVCATPPAHALPGGTSSHPYLIHEQHSTFQPHPRLRDGVNVQNVTSGVKDSSSSEMTTTNQMRLNTGGIIALSVFGGFVILAAIITIIVIIYRRKRRPRGSMDNITISTYDSGSGSENGGLSKYYKRAWENLRMDKGLPIHLGESIDKGGHNPRHAPAGRQETLDNPNYRAGRGTTYEGMRDSNEMTVSDSAAWSTRRERKPRPHHGHHHHHHHHHNGHSRGNNNNNNKNTEDDREYRPWYRLHRN